MSNPFGFTVGQLTGKEGRAPADCVDAPGNGDFDPDTVVYDWQRHGDIDLSPHGGVDGILKNLNVDKKQGLDENNEEDLSERRRVFGHNGRPEAHRVTYWELIWEGLHDVTLIILLIAAVVSIALGVVDDPVEGWHEGAAILLAVVIVLNVGAFNDLAKDKKFRQLNEVNNNRTCKALRNGKKDNVPADDLLVGDIVFLEAGDRVPADGILIAAENAVFDESAMTGESDKLKKNADHPFIISGSEMVGGGLTMVVVGVGPNSVSGRAMALLTAESSSTPLQLKLEHLATQVSKLGAFVGVICFVVMTITNVVNYARDDSPDKSWDTKQWGKVLEAFIISVTVLVVAIPEGLPLAVTISLAYSVNKMMKDNILVRHLSACETMGGATTICTDKTGTLTQNKMTVVQMWVQTPKGESSEGTEGNFLSRFVDGSAEEYAAFLKSFNDLDGGLREAILANSCHNSSAFLKVGPDGNLIDKPSGSATEGAMLIFARKAGVDYRDYRNGADEKGLLRKNFPFASARKRSSVLVWKDESKTAARLYVKGASEMVLRLCDKIAVGGETQPLKGTFAIDSEGDVSGVGQKKKIASKVINYMADSALRTIAVAYKDVTVGPDGDFKSAEELDAEIDREVEYTESEAKGSGPCPALEDGLTLCCVLGIQDPVRPEVPFAVQQCMRAGIKVIMVTGDNITTAMAIGRQCYIFHDEKWTDKHNQQHPAGFAVEGPDFREGVAKKPGYFDKMGWRLEVMARSAPEDKHLLVSNLIDRGNVVAVTGDGTNDGPALKKSDVGFAMGIAGTDVAKQASDIIIMDDNFASIVRAVLWGRNVYDSIRKFLQFQLTVNVVALALAFFASCILNDTPLKATQMLWVNLIMDTFAALALATEPPTPDLLERKPYGRTDSLISSIMARNILGQSIFQCCILFTMTLRGEEFLNVPVGRKLGGKASETVHYTMVFHTFVMLQLFNEVASRKINGELNIFEGIFRNSIFISVLLGTLVVQFLIVEFGGPYVSCHPLTFQQHLVCVIIGAMSMVNGTLIRYVPADWFGTVGHKEMQDEDRATLAAKFSRKNSKLSSRSLPTVHTSKYSRGSSQPGANKSRTMA